MLVLAAFIFINFYHKEHGFISNLPTTEDPHQVAEVTHLAPHGVPSNAIPRALSSHRLHELANQDLTYGATHHAPGNTLELPEESKGKAINFKKSTVSTKILINLIWVIKKHFYFLTKFLSFKNLFSTSFLMKYIIYYKITDF